MYDRLDYSNSAQLCEQMASECDTAILAFSTGKDSIAAWLQMRKYFKKIVPYYCYLTWPVFSFIDDALKYYEDYFGQHIYRLPHGALGQWLNEMKYQPPERVKVIQAADIADKTEYNDDVIGNIIRDSERLPGACYTATGVRMADSPYRRISTVKYGAVNHNAKRFMPIYDWVKADVVKCLKDAKIKLPVDYRLFGRTFDGIDYRFLGPLKEHYPEDYKLLLEWFPFCDLNLFRQEEVI